MCFCKKCNAATPSTCKCRIPCTNCGLRNLDFMRKCGSCGSVLPVADQGKSGILARTKDHLAFAVRVKEHNPHINDIPLDQENIKPTRFINSKLGLCLYCGDEFVYSPTAEELRQLGEI